MFEILSLSGLGNSGVRMPTKAKKKLTKGIACMKRIYPDISVVTENSTQVCLLMNLRKKVQIMFQFRIYCWSMVESFVVGMKILWKKY